MNAETEKLVADHRESKSDYLERRKIVVALNRAGFSGPDPMTGKVLEAFSTAGMFRLRSVVVGTVAYQCFSAMLGVKLGASNQMTNDLDIAQFAGVSIAVADSLDEPVDEILTAVDPRFRSVPNLSGPQYTTQFSIGQRYRVDFLTPNRGADRSEPVALEALGVDAQPLRFLDYLIYQERKAVCLFGEGILVNVPDPARFALHKLLVAFERANTAGMYEKVAKDRRQAGELIVALCKQDPYALKDAWQDLTSRGKGWRHRIGREVRMLPSPAQRLLVDMVGEIPGS